MFYRGAALPSHCRVPFEPSDESAGRQEAYAYPRLQTGWFACPDGKHITFSDGVSIGTLRLIGTRVKPGDQRESQPLRSPAAYALPTIKRVRIVRRADGYFCQFCIAVCRVQAHEGTGVERGIDVG